MHLRLHCPIPCHVLYYSNVHACIDNRCHMSMHVYVWTSRRSQVKHRFRLWTIGLNKINISAVKSNFYQGIVVALQSFTTNQLTFSKMKLIRVSCSKRKEINTSAYLFVYFQCWRISRQKTAVHESSVHSPQKNHTVSNPFTNYVHHHQRGLILNVDSIVFITHAIIIELTIFHCLISSANIVFSKYYIWTNRVFLFYKALHRGFCLNLHSYFISFWILTYIVSLCGSTLA